MRFTPSASLRLPVPANSTGGPTDSRPQPQSDSYGDLYLLNPLTGAQLPLALSPTSTLAAINFSVLPPCFWRWLLQEGCDALIFFTPSPSSMITLAIHGPDSSLALAKPGNGARIKILCTSRTCGCFHTVTRTLGYCYSNPKTNVPGLICCYDRLGTNQKSMQLIML